MINYSLDLIPFSYRGSFLLITSRNSSGSPRLLYKTCSARVHNVHEIPFPADEFFELSMIRDGVEIPYTWKTFPHKLELHGEDGEKVTITFADSDTLIFKAEQAGLRLMPSKVFPGQYSPIENEIYLIDWFARGIHMFRADENASVTASRTPIVTGIEKHWGEFPCTISFLPRDDQSSFYGAMRFVRYETFWTKPMDDFKEVLSSNEKEFNRWMEKLPDVPPKYHNTAEAAWFLLWICQVRKEGTLTRPVIYMSKFWMNAIWAWDNLFNAVAVVNADTQLAWNQITLFFDYQEPNGMIPDMISDIEPLFGFTKPPLQGWAIREIIKRIGIKKSLPFLKSLYKPLCDLTNWWYTYRDFDRDGLPQYFHGNDSGWDNSTVFDQGNPVEGSDLAAYLVLQCECLASIAEAIGELEDAERWKERAKKQLGDLLSHSVEDDHFCSPLNGTSEAEPSLSLINYIPIILGKRLPNHIRKALVKDLQPGGPFLTKFGLATEPPSSIKYMADGYWRGPIWAASTYLIFQGLLECGENKLAQLIAERFCDLCQQEPGFWENYDALTGKGLRCPGYSWTASIFLLLAEWLEAQGKEKSSN
jgi:putative isomerase